MKHLEDYTPQDKRDLLFKRKYYGEELVEPLLPSQKIFLWSIFILGVLFMSVLMIGMGSAVQEPAGWWSSSSTMNIADSTNMTDEINTTSGTLFINQSAIMRLINVALTFSSTGITTRTGQNNSVNISHSFLYGVNGGSGTNRILVQSGSNFSLINTSIFNFGVVEFRTNPLNNIEIIDSSIGNNTGRSLYGQNSFNLLIRRTSVFNSSSSESCLDLDNSINTSIESSNIYNCALRGIEIQDSNVSLLIKDSIVTNTRGVCAWISNTNYSRLINVTTTDCDGYGIDFLNNIRNAVLENSTVINATANDASSAGIAFSSSFGGINVTSKNNKVYNLTSVSFAGFHFYNITNFTSDNDYVYNSSRRGFSIGYRTNNGVINNLIIDSSPQDSLYFAEESNNITFNNLSIINSLNKIFINGSNNITFRNSLSNNSEEYYIFFGTNTTTTIDFENVDSYNFSLDNTQNLEINLSSNSLYFKSGSSQNNITINSLSSALLHNSTSICTGSSSNINSNDNNINITLTPNNYCFVLDNFNLTEGVSRENSPLNFNTTTIDGVTKTYKIGNTLQTTLNSSIVISADCDLIGKIEYSSNSGTFTQTLNSGDYTCSNDKVALSILGLESGLNTLTATSNQNIQDICSQSDLTFLEAATLAGVLLTILLLGGVVSIVLLSFSGVGGISLGSFKPADVTLSEVILGIIVIGLTFLIIATMALIIGGSYCPAIGA